MMSSANQQTFTLFLFHISVPRHTIPPAQGKHNALSPPFLPLSFKVPHEDLSPCTQHVAPVMSGATLLRLATWIYPSCILPHRSEERSLLCPLRRPPAALLLLLQIQGKEECKQLGEYRCGCVAE